MNVWTQTRYFKIGENWGDASRMNGGLILSLDLIRHYFDVPFIVHCGYEPDGHSKGSQHYVYNAVDFHVKSMSFKDSCRKMFQVIDYLQLTNFIGLGFYPEWKNPGFHIDLRGFKARWAWIDDKQVEIDKVRLL